MNERDIINMITAMTSGHSESLLKGIGDDCAVIEKDASTAWLLTMDTLVESVHFDISWHSPHQLGRKSVSVNVSDVAAMGGKPLFILLSAALPKDFDTEWFTAFSQGVAEACSEYGCLVIGGDTVRSNKGYSFTITAIGEAPKECVVYRSGARPGDDIWVSGPLGLAAAGLELFIKGNTSPCYGKLLEPHLDPKARTTFGFLLAKEGKASAMMDISDGLATDLAHLCHQSAVKGRIFAEMVPITNLLQKAADELRTPALHYALEGGEDFELLFTADPAHRAKITELAQQCSLEAARVGTILEGEGVGLLQINEHGQSVEQKISYRGFDHFPDPSAKV